MKTDSRPTTLQFLFCSILLLSPTSLAALSGLGLFGDITFVESDATDSSSFVLGTLDLYLTKNISEHMTALAEIDFHMGDDGETEVGVERLWVRYRLSDAVQFSAGRFHTPLGHWNRAYHHGALIQPTVDRPFFLEWEDDGGMIPTHVIGVMVSGEKWTKAGTFDYVAVVGNGQAMSSSAGFDAKLGEGSELDPNVLGDKNNQKSITARLSLKGDSGWRVGIFSLSQTIAETGSPADGSLVSTGQGLFDQTIFGLDLGFEHGRFDFAGEIFAIKNEAIFAANQRFDATAFLAQATYDLTEKWALSYRHSSLDVDGADPYFLLLTRQDEEHDVLSMSYRMDEVSAIKLELDHKTAGAGELGGGTTLRAQWAFLIP